MNPDAFRQDFLRRLDGVIPFAQLLDLLPDVAFFMKDRKGRFVMHNRRGYEYCRVASECETIGKTDYDFYPRDRADLYVEGDRQVLLTGEPILNAIAPAPEEDGSDKLIVYSKVPVRDRRGRSIGIAGSHREIEGLRAAPASYGRISRAVQHLHAQYAKPLSTRLLARMVGLSHSQFDRSFRRLFGASPRQYLLRVRVHAACRLLAGSDQAITGIALDAGFYDHSHFTRTFRRLMGLTPRAYRATHQDR